MRRRNSPKPRFSPLKMLSIGWPRGWMMLDRWGLFPQGSEPARWAQYLRASHWGKRACVEHFTENWAEESCRDLEVLITAYKYRELLPRAISSAVTALKHFEKSGGRGGIVVVEDCGEDGTWEWLLSQLHSADVPIRILQPKANLGLAAARNLALESTSARSVFVLDADNEVHFDALNALHKSLIANEADVAYGPIEVSQEGHLTQKKLSARPPDRKYLMTVGNYIDAMALYRTSSLKASGGWSTELLANGWGLEDYELWIHYLLEDARWAFVPQTIGTYHEKMDSMSQALNPRTEKRIFKYMRELYGPEFNANW